MRTRRARIGIGAVLAALAIVSGSARAEVSAEPGPIEVGVLVLGIIEGPDPIPQVIWEPIRDIDPELYLNPGGAVRADGRPDIAVDPLTGRPHVVWAYNNGSDHDIAYSTWDGTQWTATEFLTSDATDEIDPRIHVDDDRIYVVWWAPASNEVHLTQRTRETGWEAIEQIGQPGMRPSVATWGGVTFVAAETDGVSEPKGIFVSTRLGTNDYDSQLFGPAPLGAELDVVLHSEQGKLWMDWRHSASEFAYSEYDGGGWGASTEVPWIDDSWVKLEEIRQCIRASVLATP